MDRIATIGFFDGVHKGHKFLFRHLDRLARERALTPFIVTFEQHPRAALQADYIPALLTTPSERKALLSAYGEVLMLPFETVQTMTAEAFMTLLRDTYDVRVLLMGYDHRFGSDRLRRPQDYRRIGEALGVEVITLSEYVEGEWHVSSTEIRKALESGNIAVANDLLGRAYSISGSVVHGKGLGHKIGFPTANIAPDDAQQIIPKAGVYAGRLKTESGTWQAFINIDEKGIIEAYLPAFEGDLYGEKATLFLERFLREERHFENVEALKEQIKADVDNILHPDAHRRG